MAPLRRNGYRPDPDDLDHDEVGPEEIGAWLENGAGLIDVREPWEYVVGRIPGAVNVPMSQLNERLAEIPDNVVLVCQTGARSGNVARYLVLQGYKKVANLTSGTVGWRNAGLPIERGGPEED